MGPLTSAFLSVGFFVLFGVCMVADLRAFHREECRPGDVGNVHLVITGIISLFLAFTFAAVAIFNLGSPQ